MEEEKFEESFGPWIDDFDGNWSGRRKIEVLWIGRRWRRSDSGNSRDANRGSSSGILSEHL